MLWLLLRDREAPLVVNLRVNQSKLLRDRRAVAHAAAQIAATGEASNDASDGVPEDEDVFSGEWLASGVVSMLL